jgi:phosphatidylserine/phosphatidylglycerophosphate/cardiolipin synthase-like enzyme
MDGEGDLEFLQPGRNCWRVETAPRARVIVDACEYFRTVRQAMLRAREQILLIGWDFDTRITLDHEPDGADDAPTRLGPFVLWLSEHRPDLRIYILKWDIGALKLLGRGRSLLTAARWATHDRITFKLDGAHPHGCSHHQKIVVIDDAFAVCGGIDMTADRWDTPEHRDDDPRRRRPGGQPYDPWHDITMVVDGDCARALGELGRSRWECASGDRLPRPSPGADPWPPALIPMFDAARLAIARTRAAYDERPKIGEIETLFVDHIATAERLIYIETQYFTSRRIAEAIAARVAEPDPPEIVLLGPLKADGWLEQVAMDHARVRLARAIAAKDHRRRFRIYTPHTAGGVPIYVHAKLLIADDRVLRVGSANMNNRSLALDSECDLVLDARLAANRVHQPVIRALRHRLLAEHLGLPVPALAAELERHGGSMIAAIEAQPAAGRRLRPLDLTPPGDVETFIADNELLDPEDPDGFFEPIARRSLFRRRTLLRPR